MGFDDMIIKCKINKKIKSNSYTEVLPQILIDNLNN